MNTVTRAEYVGEIDRINSDLCGCGFCCAKIVGVGISGDPIQMGVSIPEYGILTCEEAEQFVNDILIAIHKAKNFKFNNYIVKEENQ